MSVPMFVKRVIAGAYACPPSMLIAAFSPVERAVVELGDVDELERVTGELDRLALLRA